MPRLLPFRAAFLWSLSLAFPLPVGVASIRALRGWIDARRCGADEPKDSDAVAVVGRAFGFFGCGSVRPTQQLLGAAEYKCWISASGFV